MGPAHRFRSRAAVIVTLAALPILWTPNVVVARKVVGGFRVAIPGALLFALTGGLPRAMSSCGRLRCSFRSARAFLPMAERSVKVSTPSQVVQSVVNSGRSYRVS